MSTYLLDTCTFIWLCSAPDKLSNTAKAAIDATDTSLILSDVTALEITLKWTAGKIGLPDPPRLWIDTQILTWSLNCRALSREDIYRAGELPQHHKDPFDRLLVATAIHANATILSPDDAIHAYPVSCRW